MLPDETPEKGVAEHVQDGLREQVNGLMRDPESKVRFMPGDHGASAAGSTAGGVAKSDAGTDAESKKFEKGDRQCKDAVEKGDCYFAMRSALGQRLQRDLKKPKIKKLYVNAEDKEEWKRNWCKRQYKDAIRRLRTNTKSVTEEWLSKGKCVSFLRMCYEEGGPRGQYDPETIEDCARTARRCIRMGYPFVQVDEQNGKVKYMWFSHEYSDKFQKKWEEVETQNELKGDTSGRDLKGGEKPKNAVTGGGSAEDMADEEGDDEEDEAAEAETTTTPKKERSPAQIALTFARRTVVSIQSTLASAKSLSEDIESTEGGDGDWAWARTPAVQGKIDEAIKEI